MKQTDRPLFARRLHKLTIQQMREEGKATDDLGWRHDLGMFTQLYDRLVRREMLTQISFDGQHIHHPPSFLGRNSYQLCNTVCVCVGAYLEGLRNKNFLSKIFCADGMPHDSMAPIFTMWSHMWNYESTIPWSQMCSCEVKCVDM